MRQRPNARKSAARSRSIAYPEPFKSIALYYWGPAIQPPIRRGRDRHDPAATDAAARPLRADWRAVAQGHHAPWRAQRPATRPRVARGCLACLIANIIVRRACALVNAMQFILMFRTVIARKVSHSALHRSPGNPALLPRSVGASARRSSRFPKTGGIRSTRAISNFVRAGTAMESYHPDRCTPP